MVLYCVQHPANIIKALVHRIKYHGDIQTIIFTDQAEDSVYCPIFDNVKYYKMPNFWEKDRRNAESEEVAINNTKNEMGEFLNSINISLEIFESIYVIYDIYNPFILYFELNSVNYMCIESVENWFQRFYTGDFMNWVIMKGCDVYNGLIKKMHLLDGQGKFCKKNYLFSKNSSHPLNSLVDVEVFDYWDSLINLSESKKTYFIDYYNLTQYNFDTVVLFNSLGMVKGLIKERNINFIKRCESDDIQDAIDYYKILIDYYFNNLNYALKLHPASSVPFIEAFSEFEQIPFYIPIELFSLVDKKINLICTGYSTGTGVFEKLGFNVINFEFNIFNFFKTIHYVYLALTLFKSIQMPEKILIYGIDLKQLEHFIKFAYKVFNDIKFEQLTLSNAADASHIIAVADSEFYKIINGVSDNCIISVNGDYNVEGFMKQRMVYSIVDVSKSKQTELQKFNWTVLAKNNNVISSIVGFCCSYILEHTKIRIQSTPQIDFTEVSDENKPAVKPDELKMLKDHEAKLELYCKYLQMYYESEIAGYSIRDYLEERNLLSLNSKLAFYAVDELGLMVYRVCERCGIKFSALLSDQNRTLSYRSHQNMTESLTLQSIDDADPDSYTTVFVATVWNADQISYVKGFCSDLFLFDAIANAMYTRTFLINKIRQLVDKNPGVRAGIFFTPYIHQIPGEHSELEEYFRLQGMKMRSIMHIQDDVMRDKAMEACYRKYGFDDEYIDAVCNASYPVVSYNGIYMLPDQESKYVNIVNHRRVTTNNPEYYTNTVYFFGDSCVTGLQVGDGETIESNFQRIVNKHELPYIVQNCANTYGLHYDWIFTLTDTMEFKPGDILLFCARIDWLTEQYIKQNNKKMLNNILSIHTTSVFQRPHDHGEVFTDDHHCNGKGYGLIAQKIFDDIQKAGFFDSETANSNNAPADKESKAGGVDSKFQHSHSAELKAYLNSIKSYSPKMGSIVMNCNPFTLGHRYLIEYASQQVDKLYIFVVEEDKSVFPFADRFELVKKGTADLSNVVVIPSGRFIISSLTFQQYFEKGENQDVIVDAGSDIEIFAKSIAPSLNITVRFAGEEPLDNVTRQYNASMRSILPQYGIEFAEIPRKKQGDEAISASRVRKLLETKDFDTIAELVPETTLDYLIKKYY